MYVRKDLQQDEGRKVQKRESTGSWKVLLWKVFLKGPGARLSQKTEENKIKMQTKKGKNSERWTAGKFENVAENQLLKSGLNECEG